MKHQYDYSNRPNPKDCGADCGNCPLKDCHPIVDLHKMGAPLAIVGEGPTITDVQQGTPFHTGQGELIERALRLGGVGMSQVSRLNAVLCRPRRIMTPKEWKTALECCAPRFSLVMMAASPRVVLAMGKRALQQCCGKAQIDDWIGGPSEGIKACEGRIVLPTYSPRIALQAPSKIPVFKIMMLRALKWAKGVIEWEWPPWLTEEDESVVIGEFEDLKRYSALIGVDIETGGRDPFTSKVTYIAIAYKDGGCSLDWSKTSPRLRAAVKEILEDPDVPKVMQNGQFDMLGLKHKAGINVQGFKHDTLLMHATVAPQLPHKLGFIAACEFEAPNWKKLYRSGSSSEQEYNFKDAYMTRLLYEPLQKRVDALHNGQAIYDQYMELMFLGLKMRDYGARTNPRRKVRHRRALGLKKEKIQRQLVELTASIGIENFNPDSPKQVSHLLMETLAIKPTKWSPLTGLPSWDEKALTPLVTDPREIVAQTARLLLGYRRWTKLIRVYLDGLEIDLVDFVHSTQKPYGTITGRWSSSGPNVQNIPNPKREKRGNRWVVVAPGMRDMFVPHTKDSWIVCGDYSQLELRIIALLSRDQPLLTGYAANEDVHDNNAMDLFGEKNFSKQTRDMGKGFVYGVNYGGSNATIWQAMVVNFPSLTIKAIGQLKERWYKKHPAIATWQGKMLGIAEERGYVEAPISGRREYFHDGIVEPTKIYNFPVQGTGADIMNPAALALDKALDWEKERLYFQVHDELVCSGPDPLALALKMKAAMETEVKLDGMKCTFPVDFKVGKDWGNCKEMSLDEIAQL